MLSPKGGSMGFEKEESRRKRYAIKKLGNKYSICGYTKSIYGLTFHHKNQTEKEFEIGSILGHALEKINRELEMYLSMLELLVSKN
jgi:hypothetical protein